MTRVRGKGPNKFTPWGMSAGQGSLKKVIKKFGGAKGSGRRKSKEGGQGSKTELESMDMGTLEQSPGLSYQ